VTPAENQQTVERVFDWIDTVLVNDVRPNTQAARAALRDLVAQADDARAALEQIDRLGDHRAEYPGLVKQIVRHALARLDGARP